MTRKLSDKDKKDWLNFLNSSEKLYSKDKDIEVSNKIKILDNLSEESIVSVNIPTGVPLVYSFATDFQVIEKKYLINETELKQKQELIIKQGKIK